MNRHDDGQPKKSDTLTVVFIHPVIMSLTTSLLRETILPNIFTFENALNFYKTVSLPAILSFINNFKSSGITPITSSISPSETK